MEEDERRIKEEEEKEERERKAIEDEKERKRKAKQDKVINTTCTVTVMYTPLHC